MKKRLTVLVALAGLLMLASGCTSLHTNVNNSALGVSTTAALQANVEVGEKISGNCSTSILFWLFDVGTPDKFADGVNFSAYDSNTATPGSFLKKLSGDIGPVARCKDAAAYQAVSKSNADVIIAPKYITEVSDFVFFKTVNVTVTGYKGTIKNFKNIDLTK